MSARLHSFRLLRVSASFGGARHGISWLERLAQFWRAYDTRRQLGELDARLLRDIGVTPGEALREAHRKPWDVRGESRR